MGIKNRYYVPDSINALDLARDALRDLIAQDASILEEAEFLIFGGISNPMPTVCLSALLSGEFGFQKVSCWDIKSGCSTGVLGLMQALEWFSRGAKRGVIVCSETFSKFTDPQTLQMSASTGDGACALSVSASQDWKVRGVVHGSDPIYLKSTYVPGTYPIRLETYDPRDYVFVFGDKPDTLKKMAEYWVSSLTDLLKVSGLNGSEISLYFSHQVDGTKNREIARTCGIPDGAIAMNFENFGNMGCPTVFLNYLEWSKRTGGKFKSSEKLIFHALGGGLSWAGIALEKLR